MRGASLPEPDAVGGDLTAGGRLRLLAWNAVPLAQVTVAAVLLSVRWSGWELRLLFVTAWIFLVPPLVARLLLARGPLRLAGEAFGSDTFFRWWAIACLQTLFNRLPWIEEALRLVPGLYSAWLRLWGAHVGRLTYWGPGAVVLDRSFLEIGDQVVIGVGVKLSPHLLVQGPGPGLRLQLAPIRIGEGAVVGGYSTLAPGSEVAAHEATSACQLLPPFNRWEGGRRVRTASAPDEASLHA